MLVMAAQGKMASDALKPGVRVFNNLQQAWEYHQKMRGAAS